MQSSKLLLLSILSQPPMAYSRIVVVPVTLGLTADAPQFDFTLSVEDMHTSSGSPMNFAGSFPSGSTGTLHFSFTTTSPIPVLVRMPQGIDQMILPYGWLHNYMFVSASTPQENYCDFIVSGTAGYQFDVQFENSPDEIIYPIVA
jgi:hypothetical protein